MIKYEITDRMIDEAIDAENASRGFVHDQTRAGLGAALDVMPAPEVTITPEMIDAFGVAWHKMNRGPGGHRKPGDRRAAGLAAALREAGFTVVDPS